jgi:chromosome segregation ATPase
MKPMETTPSPLKHTGQIRPRTALYGLDGAARMWAHQEPMAAPKRKKAHPAKARPTKPSTKTKRPARSSSRLTAPTAGELPATRAMFTGMRTELLDRIDQSKNELRAEIHGVKAEVAGVKAEIHGVKAEIHGVKAEVAGLKAEVARVAFLVEEQNARNKIVLDGLAAYIDRQERVEQRMDTVEDTVRSLASAHPAS